MTGLSNSLFLFFVLLFLQSLRQQTGPVLGESGDSCAKEEEPGGHPTITSQSLEEMAREGRQESPSALVQLDMGQLSDQSHKEEKCNSRNLGAFNDAASDILSPECFCGSEKAVTLSRKEEEGPASAEGSGTTPEEEDCTVSLCASVNGALHLPSCGNTNEEAGMTSAGAVVDQAGLCSKGSAQQEAQAAEERAAGSAGAVAAAAGEGPASLGGVDVPMGQTECRNCAGAAEGAAGQQKVKAEASRRRTANLEQPSPAKEESDSAAQPLLGALNGTKCADGEDADVGVIPAPGGVNAGGGTGNVSADLCKTSGDKETGADSCTDQVNGDFLESKSDASVTEGQDVTAGTGVVLPAVNGVKVHTRAAKSGPGLEIHGSRKREGQVEAGCTDGKSSLPSLTDSVETDGTDAKPADNDTAGFNQSSAEPACHQGSSKITERVAEAVESSGASEEEPAGTDTSSSSGDGGSTDSADGGQEVAVCHPSVCHTVVEDEMGDSLKPDAAGESKCEPASAPLEGVNASLAEKEPAPTGAESTESASELCGEVRPLTPLPRGAESAASQEGDAAVAPPGQEPALQGNDPGLAACAKGADCAEDNLIDTPSVIHNEPSKQNQEAVVVAAQLARQRGREQGRGAARASWCGDHEGDEGSLGQSLSQQAEGGKAEPEQEVRASGREQVLSEELLAAVVKPSACRQEGPVEGGSGADAGVKGTVSTKEACQSGAEGAGEGTMHGPASAGKAQDVESEPCPDMGQSREHDPSQTVQQTSPPSSTPELKPASETGAPGDACEGKEVSRPVTISAVAAYPEEQEDADSLLPRAALQPIAEEPTCDSDSSTDTVCPAAESDAGPFAGAAREAALAEPDGEQGRAVPESPFSPCPCRLRDAEAAVLENVEVKSLALAGDGSSLDKVPKMVKSFDAVVFAAETPSSPALPAAEKEGLEPQAAVEARANLDGESDLSSSAKKRDANPAPQPAEPATGRKNPLLSFIFFSVGVPVVSHQQRKGNKSRRPALQRVGV